MGKKLTLRVDEEIAEFAKEYSHRKSRSISNIVSNFFQTIKSSEEKENNLTPMVKSLKGILKGKDVNESDYKKHLEEKYL